ncbi:MAG TPA: PKD domain-containing protein [Nocardioides sp.]|uniref:PKD domain-containing protein n=1 Tax=Nocardioides sp. TaxID=35761 RepID=UPI002F4221E2
MAEGVSTLRGAGAVITLVAGVAAVQMAGLGPARAADAGLYVDRTMSTCSDGGAGTSTAPYCTISAAVSHLQPGGTVFIGNGTYLETLAPPSGTSSAPVTIAAWPGRQPTVGTGKTNGVLLSSRSYVTVSGLRIVGTTGAGISVSGGSHVSLIGNEVTSAGQPVKGEIAQGIRLSGTSAGLVSGNFTHDNSDHGILLTSGTTGMTVSGNVSSGNAEGYQRNANGIDVISPGNTIIGNVTHDNEDSGINIYPGGNNSLVTLNVTYNNGDHGIDDLNVTGGRLIGNTVFHNCTSGINVEGTSGNYTVKNNIAVDNAVYPAYHGISCSRRAGNIGIWDSAPATTTVDHNLVYLSKPGTMYVFKSSYSSLAAMQAATGQEKHGVQADPRFTNASGGDFTLQAGSLAIDRGDSGVSGEQAVDAAGLPRVDDPATPNTQAEGPRPYDDLGAFEYQGGGSAPSAPTAALSVSPSSGTVPLPVTADASGSTDPQGQALSYTFDFGDGTTVGPQSGATASHTYAAAGIYSVKVTVTDTSGLSDTATKSVTASEAGPSAPTAALSVSPSSGTVPLPVTADASGSTDPQGQALSYVFDFGDGTTVGPQSAATASHTYATAGTYTVKVTVTDTSGLSDSATKSVTASAQSGTDPTYVGTIANNYSTSTHTSAYVTVYKAAGVQAGDLVVLTLQLSGTSATGAVSGTDPAGNTYTAAADVTDGNGNRLVVLSGVAVNALAPNDRLTVTFPSAATYRLTADEFAGVSRPDQASTASGSAATFSSGSVQATVGHEIAFSAVTLASGSANPTWSSGWSVMGSYSTSGRYLSKAYQVASAPGGYTGSGGASGPWLAAAVTFRS